MTGPVLTLLLIENFEPDREQYRRYLLSDIDSNYHVLEAETAIAGLELCRLEQIDAILLDYLLPDGNGLDFLESLHAQSNGSSPPVVMVTGQGDERVAVQAIKLGAEDYLVKHQLTPTLLRSTLRSAIENARLRKQLKESDDRFRVSLENMLDCFGIFSAIRDDAGAIVDFRIDYLNEAALAANRMTRMAIGKNLCELLPSHHETGLFEEYCQLVETGQPLVKESLIYSDVYGQQQLTRAFDIRASKLDDGFVASWRGVTDRKQAEKRLRDSETQLKVGVEVAGVALARFNYATNTVELSPEAAVIYGLPADQLVVSRDRIHATFHPEEREMMEQIIAQVLDPAGDGWFNRDHRVVWSTGEVRWLTVRKQVFFKEINGELRPNYAILAAIDITERKRIEAALYENEQRLKAIVDNSSASIYMKDIEGRYLLMNREAERLSGITSDRVLGKTDYDLFPRETADQLRSNDLQVIEAGTALTLEEGLLLEDGIHTFITVKFPLFDREGRPYALCGISTDISDRVRFQAERERLLTEAEAARETAEAANRSKDEFVALVAHELRSPLNSILGWSKLLRGRQLNAETTARALETIERNTNAQVQLVEDLLDMSRIVSGKLCLNLAPVNLATVIESAIDLVQPQAQAKQIALTAQLLLTPQISGDLNRLQQIVVNLLTNAIKFTPEGGRVTIDLTQIETQVQVRVSDTGKGIAPEFLPRIFERYQQGQKNTGSKDGLGLGLAIVKNLVDLHQGTIAVESPGVDQGATFTLCFPMLSLPAIAQTESPRTVTPASLSGIRVLVVDDEPDMLNLISFVLEDYGAEVRSATSAASAIALLNDSAPDILLSDIAMPGGTGYDLIQDVRRMELSQNLAYSIPAIALTAYASSTYEERSLQAEFHRHLAKPVDPEVLVRAILDLVKLKQ